MIAISCIFLVNLFAQTYSQSLVCNGDFQIYPLDRNNRVWNKLDGERQSFSFLPNNYSCWYDSYGTEFQIKRIEGITTKMVDLSQLQVSNICQKINLQMNKKYLLKYQIFTSYLNSTTITVKLNQQIISQKYYEGSKLFFHHQQYFTSKQTDNQICFQGTPQPGAQNDNAFLDNIIIQYIEDKEIQQIQQHYIEFKGILFESEGTLVLVSNTTYNQTIAQQIQSQYQLIIKGSSSLLINNFLKDNETSNLIIKLYPDISFSLNQLYFKKIDGQQGNKHISLHITLAQTDKYYRKLNQQQKDVLIELETISQNIKWIIKNILSVIRGAICSYVIFDLLGFWNVTLLYIFLLIPIVPEFTKNIYYQLITAYFESGNILIWFRNYLPIPQIFYSLSQKLNLGQYIPGQINTYKWFGSFGISTDILQNNYLNFVLLLALILKIIVIKLIKKFVFEKLLKVSFGNKITAVHIFVAEITSISPELIISSLFCILGSTPNAIFQFHKISQVVLFSICIFSMALYTILEYRKNNPYKPIYVQVSAKQPLNQQIQINQQINTKQQTKKLKKIKFKQQSYLLQSCNVFLMLSTPLLIAFQNQIVFLVINAILIGFKTYALIKRFKTMDKCQKIFDSLITLIWIIHHGIFTTFYILSVKEYQQGDSFSNDTIAINILGLSSILTIFIGGVLEILYFVIQILFAIAHIIKKIRIFWNVRKQELQQNDTITKNNVDQQNNDSPLTKDFKIEVQNLDQDFIKEEVLEIPAQKVNCKNFIKEQNEINEQNQVIHHIVGVCYNGDLLIINAAEPNLDQLKTQKKIKNLSNQKIKGQKSNRIQPK